MRQSPVPGSLSGVLSLEFALAPQQVLAFLPPALSITLMTAAFVTTLANRARQHVVGEFDPLGSQAIFDPDQTTIDELREVFLGDAVGVERIVHRHHVPVARPGE